MLIFQRVKLRLERVRCKSDPTILSIECNVKFISREVANFNSNFKLLKPINYIGYRFQSFYKHSNNEYRPMLVDLRDEFCESYVKRSIILNVMLKTIGDNINFNKSCPWSPGDYYVKDFNFAIEHMPSLVPEGRYLLNITVNDKSNIIIAYWEVYFRVTNYGILDLSVG